MDNKIDLSAYMLSDADALSQARVSVRNEDIEKAVKMIAERNERTAEQAVIVAQQEEIARLRAELEAARVDAERYRIVRDKKKSSSAGIVCTGTGYAHLYGSKLDAAIDAARGGK